MKIKRVLLGGIGLFLVLAAGLVVAEDSKASDLSRAVLRIESLSFGACCPLPGISRSTGKS